VRRASHDRVRQRMTTAFIGVGANLGDPCAQVCAALRSLCELGSVSASSLYYTEPLGDPAQPWFVNAVAQLETSSEPLHLLRELKRLEQRAGRPTERERWVPRLLDLDLLLFGELVLETPELNIPHASFHRRRFVLEPLVELAPSLRDPRSGMCVREILRTLNDPLRVVRLSKGDAEAALGRASGLLHVP